MDFNTAAANWDNDHRIKRAVLISEAIRNEVKPTGSQTAMEFGCGTGLISFNLADQFKDITLIDTSEGMIEVLQQKINQTGVINMTAKMQDISMPQALSPCYDVIYSSMALHHISDVVTALQNFYALLNSEGLLCIVDLIAEDGTFHKLEKDFIGHNGFDPDRLKKTFENIGFTHVYTKVFYHDTKRIEDKDVAYSLFIITGSKRK